MTHLYTLMVGGTVLAGVGGQVASALAWAGDTVIALGSDEDVRSISRGDSHLIDLAGAWVVPLGEGMEPSWPTGATLLVGGRADLAVVAADPRRPDRAGPHDLEAIAVVRGGQVVAGGLPGDHGHAHAPPATEPGPIRS